MSDSQAYEAFDVSSDGVTVTKRFEADEFPVPAIAFNFESTRSEPVSVRLTDAVPDGVAVEDLGFHPEYGSEYWTIDDDEIVFEREIEPDAEYTTVYGIRATGTDNVEQFLTRPALDEVDPPLDGGDVDVEDGSDAVKDVISGESDEVPGLEDDDIETLDLNDPNGEGAPASAADAGTEDDAGDGGADVSASVDGDTLVAALAHELRNQEVSKDDVLLLRRAFELADDSSGSTDARIRKLQQDVSDVIAYVDALEAFLDENGTGDELIEEFQSEIDEFRQRIQTFESDLQDVQSTVSSNESELATLSSEFDGVQRSVGDVESAMSDVEGQVNGVEDTVAEVENEVESLDSRMENLNEDVEDLREDVGDGDLEDRIDEIDDEIAELKEWREQLSSVIGGGD